MLSLELAIDPEAVFVVLADLVGLTLFELEVFTAWLAMSLGFGLLMWTVLEMRRRYSPVNRMARRDRHFGGV